MIKFITDSTAYIPNDLVKKHSIEIVQQSIEVADEVFKENEISNEELFAKLDKGLKTKSAIAPTVEELYKIFIKFTKSSYDVIGTFMSQKMNNTYANALEAKARIERDFPAAQIAIINSKSDNIENGLVTLEGIDALAAGLSFTQIVDKMRASRQKIHMLYMPGILKYMEMPNLFSKLSTLAIDKTNIHLLVKVQNEVADDLTIVKSRNEGKKMLLEKLQAANEKNSIKRAAVGYVGDKGDAIELISNIKKITSTEVLLCKNGPVSAGNGGPNTLVLAWSEL